MQMNEENKSRRVLRISLREECRKRLTEMVIKGYFGEGERLNETKIAKELGVSQTPVREALVTLECQGFLTSYPNRGFEVKPFSRKEGHDLYRTIAELEVIALRDGVWPDQELLAKAEVLNQKFKAEQDPEERVKIDIEWHDLLISQTKNKFLCGLINLTRKRVFRYEWNFMSGNIEQSFQDHKDIIFQLKKGNVNRAASMLKRNHLSGISMLDDWLSMKHSKNNENKRNELKLP